MTPADVHEISTHLALAAVPHETYDGACGTPDCIVFGPRTATAPRPSPGTKSTPAGCWTRRPS